MITMRTARLASQPLTLDHGRPIAPGPETESRRGRANYRDVRDLEGRSHVQRGAAVADHERGSLNEREKLPDRGAAAEVDGAQAARYLLAHRLLAPCSRDDDPAPAREQMPSNFAVPVGSPPLRCPCASGRDHYPAAAIGVRDQRG